MTTPIQGHNKNTFCSIGSEDTILSDEQIQTTLQSFLETIGGKERHDIMIIPPDYTRFHSQAGKLTRFICEYYNFIPKPNHLDSNNNNSNNNNTRSSNTTTATTSMDENIPNISILPALGTHMPMTQPQIKTMFGDALATKHPSPFLVHDWRNDVVTIGSAPEEMVSKATNGMISCSWPAQLNTKVWEKRYDASTTTSKQELSSPSPPENKKQKPNTTPTQKYPSLILSIGQVVPHEVMGMANFNKNLFVGVGGVEAINLSHFIGAVHGMERMMGRASNPLRSILNYASEEYLQNQLDLWYILTVMGMDKESGKVVMRGLYIGNDISCYNLACELSLKVNFTILDHAPKKVVVYLDSDEFHSTWLGNKAIYRTRMAIDNDGELIILAPGVKQFGEDDEIDKLIRSVGYIGTPAVLECMKNQPELNKNLSAVAHLIHGSSEGRFRITYCPGHLSKEEIESVGFEYGDLKSMLKRYDVDTLKDGWNVSQDKEEEQEEFFYISNPALGLWATQDRFAESDSDNTNGNTVVSKEGGDSILKESRVQESVTGSGGVGGWKQPPSE